MFLIRVRTSIRNRIGRLTTSHDSERGIALIAAIGVMAVLMIVVMTIAASSMSATGFASATRAGVQSRAASDAGIDAVRAKLMAGSFVCSLSGTNPTFSATVIYADSAGSALGCAGGVVAGVPKTARITSTGQASSPAVVGTSTEDSAVGGATVNIVVTPAGATLSKAMFSESDLFLTNNTSALESGTGLADAKLYSNGKITCSTAARIQGDVYAQGNFLVSNNCDVDGTVWSGGTVSLKDSNVDILGNVFAAGTGEFQGGKARIQGSVIANGEVTFSGNSDLPCGASNSNVCGSVYSLRGGITLANTATISGSAYARTTVAVQSGVIRKNVVSLAVSPPSVLPLPTAAVPSFVVPQSLFSPSSPTKLGTSSGSPVTVVGPPRESMPQIPASKLATDWTGWTVIPDTTLCTAGSLFGTKLKAITDGYPATAKLAIRIDGCTAPVAFENQTLVLTNDVALMSPKGFKSQNDLFIKSSSSTVHQLSWIVPSDAPGVTWTASDPAFPGQLSPSCTGTAPPDISMSKVNEVTNIQWFIYTPCRAALEFGHLQVDGQIYAGKIEVPTGVIVKRAIMNIPGVVVPGGAPGAGSVSATLTSRYDVSR